MLKDYESVCSNCDKIVNDDTETTFDEYADPYCPCCFNKIEEL